MGGYMMGMAGQGTADDVKILWDRAVKLDPSSPAATYRASLFESTVPVDEVKRLFTERREILLRLRKPEGMIPKSVEVDASHVQDVGGSTSASEGKGKKRTRRKK